LNQHVMYARDGKSMTNYLTTKDDRRKSNDEKNYHDFKI
jgi:hypothetical protein